MVFIGGDGDAGQIVGSFQRFFQHLNPNIPNNFFQFNQYEKIIKYLNDVDPDQTITIVGHSFGATTAVHFAATFWRTISQLITVDGSYLK